MPDTTLPDYLGRQVTRTAIKITRAGDGLSAGMAIEPELLDPGSTVYVVLECVVDSHEHDRVLDKGNDTGLMVLNQVLVAGTGVIIDAEVVKEAIAQQAAKIDRAKEQAQGVQRLPTDEELYEAHTNGEHASGLVDGCVECSREALLTAAEDEPLGAPPADDGSNTDPAVQAPEPDAGGNVSPIGKRKRGKAEG